MNWILFDLNLILVYFPCHFCFFMDFSAALTLTNVCCLWSRVELRRLKLRKNLNSDKNTDMFILTMILLS